MGKQVKTPRFYVDMVTFLHATGQLGWDSDNGGAELLYMNCANPYLGTSFQIGANSNIKTSFPINFVGLLNHNLAGTDLIINGNDAQITPTDSVINYDNLSTITYNGTSIFTFAEDNQVWEKFTITIDDTTQYQLGSFVVGKYFNCPNSPDLNLTMSRRFDGIKRQKTVGGKTLANIYYDGPTEWTMNNADGTTYKYPPFELDTTDSSQFDQRVKSGIGRKGLRSWKLTFSYITESDMWIDNEVSNTLISDGESTPENNDPNPMLSDNSFNFVWNCTLGGTLPFIFTDDKDSNEPDRYAICNFRENSLSVQQVAFNTYKVSMTIDEIA
jgi:hypothetical protein